MTDAASPTTNTPGASTTFRNGSIIARPARSVLVPSIFGIGDAATPAVHSTVALGILLPPARLPGPECCAIPRCEHANLVGRDAHLGLVVRCK
jgi:hypothetical protein